VFPGQPNAGPEALTWLVALLETQAEIERLVVEGDWVVVRAIWSGTHQSQFVGFTPTGKHVKVLTLITFGLACSAIGSVIVRIPLR
jgi:predicted ester cyclase